MNQRTQPRAVPCTQPPSSRRPRAEARGWRLVRGTAAAARAPTPARLSRSAPPHIPGAAAASLHSPQRLTPSARAAWRPSLPLTPRSGLRTERSRGTTPEGMSWPVRRSVPFSFPSPSGRRRTGSALGSCAGSGPPRPRPLRTPGARAVSPSSPQKDL